MQRAPKRIAPAFNEEGHLPVFRAPHKRGSHQIRRDHDEGIDTNRRPNIPSVEQQYLRHEHGAKPLYVPTEALGEGLRRSRLPATGARHCSCMACFKNAVQENVPPKQTHLCATGVFPQASTGKAASHARSSNRRRHPQQLEIWVRAHMPVQKTRSLHKHPPRTCQSDHLILYEWSVPSERTAQRADLARDCEATSMYFVEFHPCPTRAPAPGVPSALPGCKYKMPPLSRVSRSGRPSPVQSPTPAK